ncbi:YncE family protein [Actinosynnema sp. NPDC059335]|uniref:YncE family protein n=1 Tax=Actinosynnema sp. NPDC059335 TaxID=3346804 RepID=UPI00367191D9
MPFAAGTVRDIPVHGLKLCGLTWTGEFLMFSEAVSNQIMALDPYSGQVEHRIPCPEVRTDLTTVGGNLVQVVGERRALRVMDPRSGDELREFPNPRPGNVLCGLEATRQGIWLGYEDLRRIDLRGYEDFELLDSFAVSGRPAGVTVSDNYLAYADYAASTITMVDIDERREAASFSVAGNPTGITWDGTRIWYCDYTTLQLRAIEVPGVDKT